MRLRPSLRGIQRLVLSVVVILAAVFTMAPPAQAIVVHGPFYRDCKVHGRYVNFQFWVQYYADATFSVFQVIWDTDFTPSRLVISLRDTDGDAPVVRAWGGSASTLHDVDSHGNTGGGWEVQQHRLDLYDGIFARVYLNQDEYCNTQPLVET